MLRRFTIQFLFALTATAAAVFATASTVRAESDVAIHGVILDDSTGLPIEQARIRIDGAATVAVTDVDGSFELRSVPLGLWTVIVDRSGYKPRRINSVSVVEGFSRFLQVTLEPDPITLPSQSINAGTDKTAEPRRIEITPESASSRSLADLLATIPGIRVYGGGDTPGGTRIAVGGEPAYCVVVTLDGLPLSGGIDGAVDLDAIPVGMLSAIELHPGSQGAMSGDGAVGGTVNLLSRQHSTQSHFNAQSSSWGGYHQKLNGGVTLQHLQFSGGLEHHGQGASYDFTTEADSTGSRHNAAIDGWCGFSQFDALQSNGPNLLGYGSSTESGSPGPSERETLTARKRNRNARIQSAHEFGKHVSLSAWYEFTSEYYNSMGEKRALYQFNTYIREHFGGLRWSTHSDLLSTQSTLEAEARYRSQLGEDYSRPNQAFGEHDRAEYSVRSSLQRRYSLPLGILSPSLAVAVNAEPNAPSVWTPRVDVAWSLLGAVTLSSGWGKSYRRAPLTSLFWKADYQSVGNPNLRPERATEWDVSTRVSRYGITADTRYFERDVTDIIVWDMRGIPPRYQPVNLAAAHVLGREDHLGVNVLHRSLAVDYTHIFTDGNDQSGEINYQGKELVFTPRHTHDLSLHANYGQVSGAFNGRWVSERYTLRANTKHQKPYSVFDTELRFSPKRANPQMTMFVRAENVTNESIELLEGYPSPARTISVGFTFELE